MYVASYCLLTRIVMDPFLVASELFVVKKDAVLRRCTMITAFIECCAEDYHFSITCSCRPVTVRVIVVSSCAGCLTESKPQDTTRLR
jgi:hypothetical protein